MPLQTKLRFILIIFYLLVNDFSLSNTEKYVFDFYRENNHFTGHFPSSIKRGGENLPL